MAHCTDLFPASFFLKSSNNGFYLHKIKRLTISSNFKFKSKIFNKSTQPSKQVIEHAKQYEKRQSAQCSSRFKSLNLDSAQKIQKQKEQLMGRYDSRSSAIIKAKFPQIRAYNTNSLARSIANRAKGLDEDTQNNFQKGEVWKQKIKDEQIGQLIEKEILKTENQTILKQEHIKFDESKIKANKTHQIKRFGNGVKRRKRKGDDPTSLEFQRRKNCISIQNPQIQKFNPLRIRYIEAMPPEDKRVSNKILKMANKDKKMQKFQEKVTAQGVRGWDNDSISNQSEMLGSYQMDKDRKIHFVRLWGERDQP